MIYFYTNNGRITRCGDIPEQEAQLAAVDGESWIAGKAGASNESHWVVNGQLEPMPIRPSIYHVWDWGTGQWVGTEDTIANLVADAETTIDVAAGRARQRYITTTPGQDATYTMKYAEAKAYRDAGYPSDTAMYPFIAGESFPNAERSAQEAADRIIQLGDMWSGLIGPKIECIRVNGKDGLKRLTTHEEISQHVAGVVGALDAV